MSSFKPSQLRVVVQRDPERTGGYQPSAYFRMHEGEVEQMWWSEAGDAVWEAIASTPGLTLKDIAMGQK